MIFMEEEEPTDQFICAVIKFKHGGGGINKYIESETTKQKVIPWLLYLVSNGMPPTYNPNKRKLDSTASKPNAHPIIENEAIHTLSWTITFNNTSSQLKQRVKQVVLEYLKKQTISYDDDDDDDYSITRKTDAIIRIASSMQNYGKKLEWDELIEFINNAMKHDNKNLRDISFMLMFQFIKKEMVKGKIDIKLAVVEGLKLDREPIREVISKCFKDYLFVGDAIKTIASSLSIREERESMCQVFISHFLLYFHDSSRRTAYCNQHIFEDHKEELFDIILATFDSKSIGSLSDTLKKIRSIIPKLDCSRLVMPLVQLFKPPHIVGTDEYRIVIDILCLIYPNIPKKLVSRSIHQLFKYTITAKEDQVFNLLDLKNVIRFSRDVMPVYLSQFLKHIYVKLDIDKDDTIYKIKDDEKGDYKDGEDEEEYEDEDEDEDEYENEYEDEDEYEDDNGDCDDEEEDDDDEEEEELVVGEDQVEIRNNLLLLNEIVKVVSLSNIYPYALVLAKSLTKYQNRTSSLIIPHLFSSVCHKETIHEMVDDKQNVILGIFDRFFRPMHHNHIAPFNFHNEDVRVPSYIEMTSTLHHLIDSVGKRVMGDSQLFYVLDESLSMFADLQQAYFKRKNPTKGNQYFETIEYLGAWSSTCHLIFKIMQLDGIRVLYDDLPSLPEIITKLVSDLQKAKNGKHSESFYPKLAVFGGSILYIFKKCKVFKIRLDKDWFKIEHARSIMVDLADFVDPQNSGCTYSDEMIMIIERIMAFVEHYISFAPVICGEGLYTTNQKPNACCSSTHCKEKNYSQSF
ncbi:hypothetical protein DFA_10475 [Cavenderia fasciculata]|uniref:Uncharacterized protein n=1 Tax=Cavenderia fasciculata TaxID=261658 RepID=F4QAB4_CACFS|nr:uncharacterized protein DFA_10475 [Cavenderia fasciculata]EGG15633.1 hypothetical protein DFA_10475 [Cavenderia fasciculata]|eukprot:XP_004354375.1 hypothetical protein DFA_10475 [Cavenderia fasciculata]